MSIHGKAGREEVEGVGAIVKLDRNKPRKHSKAGKNEVKELGEIVKLEKTNPEYKL